MSSTTTTTPAPSYLEDGSTVASWLLTRDHKRIAILYLIAVTVFFAIGGMFAVLDRKSTRLNSSH